jgi:hypothetical protein
MTRSGWHGGLLVIALLLAGASPARSALLSSIQTGTTFSTSAGTVTVPITSVDTTRSFLVFQMRSSSNRPVASYFRGRLESATSVEFVRATDEPMPARVDIRWYVVSFASGVRVQRGEVAQTASTINVPIAAVAAVNQAFVLWSKSADAADQTWGLNDPVLAELTSTTNLQIRVDGSNAGHTIAWQVVEFTNTADINVQKGSIATMTGATTSVNATLGTAVDPSRTFLLVGFRAGTSSAGVGGRMLRAQLVNSTTITIDRSIAGGPDNLTEISWQAIELRDGSQVQRGSENFAAGVAQKVVNLAAPVDPRRSIAFAAVQSGGGQSMGRTPYNADDIIGVGSTTTALTTTQLTLDRNSTLATTDVGWFVVQFKNRRVMVTGD